MENYILNLSDNFSEYFGGESKGCFELDIKIYTFNFYDPIRLNQKIEDDLN
jgi:hypothetical protein